MSKFDKLHDDILSKVEDVLYILDEDIEHNIVIHIETYKKQLLSLLNAIINLQAEHLIDKVGIVEIVLSRINIDNSLYFYKVNIYKDKLYDECYRFDFSIDVSNVYKHFSDARESLYHNYRNYINLIEPCNIDAGLNRYIKYFNMYVVKILRETLKLKEVVDALNQLKATDQFYIIQCEIYEIPYLIYEKIN